MSSWNLSSGTNNNIYSYKSPIQNINLVQVTGATVSVVTRS